MADVVDRSTRSHMMAAVRSRNTAPELRVRRYLHAAGLRFKLHPRELAGRPDIVLPRHSAVIFVHGCFWHLHARCAKAKLPETNRAFWSEKLGTNVRRDRATRKRLQTEGWRVLIVWECETRDPQRLLQLLEQVRGTL